MHRLTLVVAAALASMVVAATPAAAIINGELDGNAHPAVGALVSTTPHSDGTWLYCSGTLISPTVFLTAAHCGTDGTRVGVTFESAYQPGDRVHYGAYESDPLYGHDQSGPHDITVVVFDKPVKGITPAGLPEAGSLSGLPATQQFTSVGYGAYEVRNQPGGKDFVYGDVRMVSVGTLNATNPAWLRISQNAAKDDGGTCYGDSGGPNFLGTSSVVAGRDHTREAGP